MLLGGLDVGQVLDHTALVLVEPTEEMPAKYFVRYVYRWQLNLSNSIMIAELKRLMEACMPETVMLNVDTTGKGMVFAEFMERHFMSEPRLHNVVTDYSVFTKAMKENLVSNVKLLLGEDRLKFVRGDGTYALMLDELFDELCNYQVRFTSSPIKGKPGSELGALGYGMHDDLATALFLALEDAEQSSSAAHVHWIKH